MGELAKTMSVSSCNESPCEATLCDLSGDTGEARLLSLGLAVDRKREISFHIADKQLLDLSEHKAGVRPRVASQERYGNLFIRYIIHQI